MSSRRSRGGVNELELGPEFDTSSLNVPEEALREGPPSRGASTTRGGRKTSKTPILIAGGVAVALLAGGWLLVSSRGDAPAQAQAADLPPAVPAAAAGKADGGTAPAEVAKAATPDAGQAPIKAAEPEKKPEAKKPEAEKPKPKRKPKKKAVRKRRKRRAPKTDALDKKLDQALERLPTAEPESEPETE